MISTCIERRTQLLLDRRHESFGCFDANIAAMPEYVHDQLRLVHVRYAHLKAPVIQPEGLLLRMPLFAADPLSRDGREYKRSPLQLLPVINAIAPVYSSLYDGQRHFFRWFIQNVRRKN